jgi:hypothetical protein
MWQYPLPLPSCMLLLLLLLLLLSSILHCCPAWRQSDVIEGSSPGSSISQHDHTSSADGQQGEAGDPTARAQEIISRAVGGTCCSCRTPCP